MSLITTFSLVEVSPGDAEKFSNFFKEVQAFLSQQQGFVSNELYRHGSSSTVLRYMVVGKWKSPEALRAAAASQDWEKLMSERKMALSPQPFEEVKTE